MRRRIEQHAISLGAHLRLILDWPHGFEIRAFSQRLDDNELAGGLKNARRFPQSCAHQAGWHMMQTVEVENRIQLGISKRQRLSAPDAIGFAANGLCGPRA